MNCFPQNEFSLPIVWTTHALWTKPCRNRVIINETTNDIDGIAYGCRCVFENLLSKWICSHWIPSIFIITTNLGIIGKQFLWGFSFLNQTYKMGLAESGRSSENFIIPTCIFTDNTTNDEWSPFVWWKCWWCVDVIFIGHFVQYSMLWSIKPVTLLGMLWIACYWET